MSSRFYKIDDSTDKSKERVNELENQVERKDAELLATNERLAKLEGQFEAILKTKLVGRSLPHQVQVTLALLWILSRDSFIILRLFEFPLLPLRHKFSHDICLARLTTIRRTALTMALS